MAVSCRLSVKTIPGASRNAIEGWIGEELKVKVTAPAVDGRANAALCEFLADQLGVPRRTLILLRGEKSRHKVIGIEHVTPEDLRCKIEDLIAHR